MDTFAAFSREQLNLIYRISKIGHLICFM